MSTSDREIQEELITILDKIIQDGGWTGSSFLEACGKKFIDLRARLVHDFGLDVVKVEQKTSIDAFALTADKLEIYILLYQADGLNLKKWESLLNSINVSSLGRPIYKNQQDVENVMRLKGNSQNDGYATVIIQIADILKATAMQPTKDRLGHELVPVREGAIITKNIKKFMHSTGQYQLTHTGLTKLT